MTLLQTKLLFIGLFVAICYPAIANDECGPDNPGQDTITCNQSNHGNGITYMDSDGLTLVLDNPAMVVGGDPGVSVRASATTMGSISVIGTSFDTITYNQSEGGGLWAYIINPDSTGSVSVELVSGDITTTAWRGYGISSEQEGLGTSTARMVGGSINTAGNRAYGVSGTIDEDTSTATTTAIMEGGSVTTADERGFGVYARTDGLGDAVARLDGGTILTAGSIGYGVNSFTNNPDSTGTSIALMTGGDITTGGTSGVGLSTDVRGIGDSLAQMDDGTIRTGNTDAFGIYSTIKNTASAASSSALMNGGDIITSGDTSHGVYAFTKGEGTTVAEMSGGTITTSATGSHGMLSWIDNDDSTATAGVTFSNGSILVTGADAHSLVARTTGNGNAEVSATAGTVSAGGLNAHGAFASSVGGDVTVTLDAQITGGSDSGYAAYTETAAGQTSTITVNGSANLSSVAGLAIFNNEGDSQTTLEVGAQVVGEIRLGNGSDTLDIRADASGITVMDGGDDANAGDSWNDVLRIQDVTSVLVSNSIRNWEEVYFIDSNLEIDDLSLASLNVNGGSTTLGGSSLITDVLGATEDETVILTDDTAIANAIEGAGGADILSVLGNATVNGGVFGAGAGQDAAQ